MIQDPELPGASQVEPDSAVKKKSMTMEVRDSQCEPAGSQNIVLQVVKARDQQLYLTPGESAPNWRRC